MFRVVDCGFKRGAGQTDPAGLVGGTYNIGTEEGVTEEGVTEEGVCLSIDENGIALLHITPTQGEVTEDQLRITLAIEQLSSAAGNASDSEKRAAQAGGGATAKHNNTTELTFLRLLLQRGCTDDMAFIVAARAGHHSVVKCLIEQGVNVHYCDKDGKNAFFYALERHIQRALAQSSNILKPQPNSVDIAYLIGNYYIKTKELASLSKAIETIQPFFTSRLTVSCSEQPETFRGLYHALKTAEAAASAARAAEAAAPSAPPMIDQPPRVVPMAGVVDPSVTELEELRAELAELRAAAARKAELAELRAASSAAVLAATVRVTALEAELAAVRAAVRAELEELRAASSEAAHVAALEAAAARTEPAESAESEAARAAERTKPSWLSSLWADDSNTQQAAAVAAIFAAGLVTAFTLKR
jgi:hypothetical protein